MLTGKKAVIFDLDGTLIDSLWLWEEIDVEYLARFGIPYPEKLADGIGGMSFSETAAFFQKSFGIPRSAEEIMADWNEMAFCKYTHEVPLKPGVREFLKDLKRRGFRTGIATSNSRTLAEEVLRALSVEEYFDEVLTACEAGKGKPAPDVYLAVAKRLLAAPSECLVFEDMVEGILAGKNAGMEVCAVRDRYSEAQIEEKKRLADYLLDSFENPAAAVRLCAEQPHRNGD